MHKAIVDSETGTGMLVAGVDIGTATAKIVMLGDSEILSYAIRPTAG